MTTATGTAKLRGGEKGRTAVESGVVPGITVAIVAALAATGARKTTTGSATDVFG